MRTIAEQSRQNIILRKLLALVCVFAMVFQFANVTAFAAGIEGSNGTMNISSDSSYIYISYSGKWSNYIGEQISVSADNGTNLGSLSGITINQSNDGDDGSITVRNAWNSAISGASGSVSNSGKKEHYGYEKMKWSIQVPVSAYADYSFNGLNLSWGGKTVSLSVSSGTTQEQTTEEETTEKVTETATEENTAEQTTEVASTEDASTEETTEITTEVTTEQVDTEQTTEDAGTGDSTEDKKEDDKEDIVVTGGVQIDGMYDDWKDIPKTEITYSSNNNKCNHYGQLFTDGDTLYGHFQANELYQSYMKIQIWNLTINGRTFALQILPANSDGSIAWGTNYQSKGSHTNLKVYIGYYNECDSRVVYTVYDETHATDTPGDEVEFALSMKRLSEITGIPQDQMGTITISNPNLGGQGVTIAGSSTGPVAGVVAAFFLVAAYFKRKKDLGVQ